MGEVRTNTDNRCLPALSKLFCRVLLKIILEGPLTEIPGVTSAQLACVHFVQRHRQITVSDVAAGLSVSRAAATNLVERLVRKGLVTRESNPEDRRQIFIRITPLGDELLRRVLGRQEENFNRILEQMEPAAVEALAVGLNAFLQAAIKEGNVAEQACARCGTDHFVTCPVALVLKRRNVKSRY